MSNSKPPVITQENLEKRRKSARMALTIMGALFLAAGLPMTVYGIVLRDVTLIRNGSFLAMCGAFDIGAVIYLVRKGMM